MSGTLAPAPGERALSRVLLVEDHPLHHVMLLDGLTSRLGGRASVCACHRLDEALAALADGIFDGMLTDWALPGGAPRPPSAGSASASRPRPSSSTPPTSRHGRRREARGGRGVRQGRPSRRRRARRVRRPAGGANAPTSEAAAGLSRADNLGTQRVPVGLRCATAASPRGCVPGGAGGISATGGVRRATTGRTVGVRAAAAHFRAVHGVRVRTASPPARCFAVTPKTWLSSRQSLLDDRELSG